MQVDKKELKYYVISILILTFVFGFNDRTFTFELSYWLKNLVLIFIAVTVSFLLKQFIIKVVAHKNGFDCKYEIWKIGRFGFDKGALFKWKRKKILLPFGIIFPILFTLLSKGLFYFPVVGTSKLIANKTKRVGKSLLSGSGMERAKIYLVGPLTYLFLTLIFFNLQKIMGVNFEVFILVNLYMAFYGLLPLPNLEGCEILFNSLPLYIFALAFFIATYILLKTTIIITILFGLLIAVLILIIYMFKYEQ